MTLRFIIGIWGERYGKSGIIGIKCNNLIVVLDCSKKKLKTKKSKCFRAILHGIKKLHHYSKEV